MLAYRLIIHYKYLSKDINNMLHISIFYLFELTNVNLLFFILKENQDLHQLKNETKHLKELVHSCVKQ